MRRLLAFAAVGVLTAAVAGLGGCGDGAKYLLRVSFDSGSGLRTGMDVRVSGLRVGVLRKISLDQTDPAVPRAVATLEITDPALRAFRADATCSIRSASLLGDRVIECHPTQPRPAGVAAPPLLEAREVGGESARVIDVAHTASPVDPDLVLDIFRLPVRQRLSIVLDELGTGLAGNGAALHDAVRRADPAFLQLGRVLAALERQRGALARLVHAGDRVLAPLARERERLAGFVVHGNRLFEAVGRQRSALRQTFARLPRFLAELRPTLHDLDGMSAQAGPALADLATAARPLSRATVALAPAARAGTPALRALGAAADSQRGALTAVQPILAQLARITPRSTPTWRNLDDLLSNLHGGGGLNRLAQLPLALGSILNGYDRYGYYTRVQAIITTCGNYAVKQTATCGGTFVKNQHSASRLLSYLLGGGA